MSYEVISEGTVSVPRDKETIKDQFGNDVSVLLEEKLYKPGSVIDDNDVSKFVKERLENGDKRWNSLLKKVSKDAGDAPLSEPVEGYDELSDAEVLDQLRNLSSEDVSKVKEYEAANKGREEVLEFNVASKEAPSERVETVVEPTDESKAKRGRPSKKVDPKSDSDTKVVNADAEKKN